MRRVWHPKPAGVLCTEPWKPTYPGKSAWVRKLAWVHVRLPDTPHLQACTHPVKTPKYEACVASQAISSTMYRTAFIIVPRQSCPQAPCHPSSPSLHSAGKTQEPTPAPKPLPMSESVCIPKRMRRVWHPKQAVVLCTEPWEPTYPGKDFSRLLATRRLQDCIRTPRHGSQRQHRNSSPCGSVGMSSLMRSVLHPTNGLDCDP